MFVLHRKDSCVRGDWEYEGSRNESEEREGGGEKGRERNILFLSDSKVN